MIALTGEICMRWSLALSLSLLVIQGPSIPKSIVMDDAPDCTDSPSDVFICAVDLAEMYHKAEQEDN